jgi:hypothetical protein
MDLTVFGVRLSGNIVLQRIQEGNWS